MNLSLVLKVIVSIWLVYISVKDWREQKVPYYLTTYPFLATVAWKSESGAWVLSVLLVLIMVTAQWSQTWVVGMAGGLLSLAWAIPQGVAVTTVIWLVAISFWVFGLIGGADAKVVMTLSALFPDDPFWLYLLLAWAVVGLIQRIVVHREATLQKIAASVQALLHYLLRYFTGRATDDDDAALPDSDVRYPLMPAISIAGLICLWMY
jgi:hypothetical protein